ncbi:MAG: hypothetical protein C0418_00355 [Coriobacteriaceae bacterium]|nr:hypothetical protein [Coriobacteriaceae bacterium]
MSDVTVDAVVLAGGDGAVIDPTCRFKGLVPIAGKPMIEWVTDALRASSSVAEIAVVVPTAEDLGLWADRVDKLVVSDGEFMANVEAGVRAFREDRPVLVTTGDIPMLTPEAVDDFVARSIERGAEFAYPLVPKRALLEQYPGSQRTYVRLATGEATGGNMVLVDPKIVPRLHKVGQHLFDKRKDAAGMLRVLGLRFVFRLLTGRLHPADVEAKVGQLFDCTGVAVFTEHASIGADVDKPVDVVVAERVLYERASR